MRYTTSQLGPLCTKLGSGVTPRGGEAVYVESGTALIRSQNVYNLRFSVDGLAHIDEEQARKMRGVTVESNDVLLNITGDSVARTCVVPDYALPARVNQHVAIIRPNAEKLDPFFLNYILVSPRMQSTLLSVAGSGGTRKALTKEMLEGLQVPTPDIEVQRRVVEVLKNYDDLIEVNRRRIRLLEEAARLIYREWFVCLRFPGHEQTVITDGDPDGWHRIEIGKVAPFRYGKGIREHERIPGDVPVMSSAGQMATHNKPLIEGPGLVIGRKGSVGTVHLVLQDFWPTDTAFYVSGIESLGYLFHAFQSAGFINTDVAVPGLNRDFAHSRKIFWPKADVREEFSRLVFKHAEMKLHLERTNAKLVRARDLLLSRLMSGKIEL